MSLYKYPRTKFVGINSIEKQIQHIKSEVIEAETAQSLENQIMEICDIEHGAETALRILEEQLGIDVDWYREQVRKKNDIRKYYGEESQ